ncbi:hypothetical protein BKA65DRAFT_107761 [Rhexocercosporidium sp. MPI-PUGE-AT-0058]|nr:hypothetical protein BKA65DRAFT_107761 [Rhexocercosporidium sp. MPI-PUGE-AT-0058]
MTSNPNMSPATINAASHIVLSSMTLIGDFLTRTHKYRERLSGRDRGSAAKDSWRKVGWIMFRKDELKALKDALHLKLTSVSLLLDTAQFYEKAPQEVKLRIVESPSQVSSNVVSDRESSKSNSREAELDISTFGGTQSTKSPKVLHKSTPNIDVAAADDEMTENVPSNHPQPTSQSLTASSDFLLEKENSLGSGSTTQMRKQVNSIRMVDITPAPTVDEATCKKKLTTYQAYTIRKIIPVQIGEKATWARSEVMKEPLSQETIIESLRRLSNNVQMVRSVKEKLVALAPFQHGQVTRLVDELLNDEEDPSYGWTIEQLDRKEAHIGHGKYETKTITVYAKRAPREGSNVIALYHAWEKSKAKHVMLPPTMPHSSAVMSHVASSTPTMKATRRPRLSIALRRHKLWDASGISALPLEDPRHLSSGTDADYINTPPSSVDGNYLSTDHKSREYDRSSGIIDPASHKPNSKAWAMHHHGILQ